MRDTQAFDREHFFDAFPRFLYTSETTGRRVERFNGRYLALIDANRDLINGATVLDLASHDGRWSFAALQNGAAKVVGIEHKPGLVRKSRENMEFYGVPPTSYEFISGDMFDALDNVESPDIVFCFGVFYHINNHMLLLSKIARLRPRVLILDTNISLSDEPVIELLHELDGKGPLVGRPSKPALQEMFASLGWSFECFDWKASGLTGPGGGPLSDYWSGERRPARRLTAVVRCR